MEIFTKETLIQKLKEIRSMGWIKNARPGNVGGIGNTLEDLLGIEENNLPIPNAAEWELKTQRMDTTSLTTLFHMEPSPRTLRFVPKILLPKYGWPHEEAGTKYPENEMSFRQTIPGTSGTDRGFKVKVNHDSEKVLISFDSKSVSREHAKWLESVQQRVGLGELDPQPYWGFDDLFHKAGTKLLNCFYVQAQRKKKEGEEFFLYDRISVLQKFSLEKFLKALQKGTVEVDFDARTGHNHGTKFRLRQGRLTDLYDEVATF
jgi:hypothetical protein